MNIGGKTKKNENNKYLRTLAQPEHNRRVRIMFTEKTAFPGKGRQFSFYFQVMFVCFT